MSDNNDEVLCPLPDVVGATTTTTDSVNVVVTPPPVVECPEGYVPGWLDEDGNAQGCVNNGPIPTPESEPEPTPTIPVPSDPPTDVSTLAETGVDPLVGLIVAACLIGAGLWLKR